MSASNIEEATQTPITLFYIKKIVNYTKFIIYIIIKLKKSNKFVFIIKIKKLNIVKIMNKIN